MTLIVVGYSQRRSEDTIGIIRRVRLPVQLRTPFHPARVALHVLSRPPVWGNLGTLKLQDGPRRPTQVHYLGVDP